MTREGAFVRQESRFRELPAGPPERYHLYASRACPWSHRTLIARVLLGLEERLAVSHIHPYRDERGWAFSGGDFVDHVNGFAFLREAYERTEPGYDGRVTSPVLWDLEAGRIDCNDSSLIVRALDRWVDGPLFPEALRAEVDELTEWIHRDFQNGVYRAGFARSQQAYDEAFHDVVTSRDRLEALLAERRYLAGEAITGADVLLLPTLLRFDAVYHTHFRCNDRRLVECPNLLRYTRDLFHQPGVAATFELDEIKEHYYTTHDELEPKRIIPGGPLDLGFTSPP
ncbi:MAG: glutathione S-transferase C-terminal domain-containing protein [Gaiella sp.]